MPAWFAAESNRTLLTAITILGLLILTVAIGLTVAANRMPTNRSDAVDAVNRLLPQTQCGQCGYPGCRPYAEAILKNSAPINRCPPGGDSTLRALAELLDRPATGIDESLGQPTGGKKAFVDESACIGCARCLHVCPVDAILGAHQFMHTVIADECTGCELCVAACPVDCISLRP